MSGKVKKISVLAPKDTENRHVKKEYYLKEVLSEGCLPIPHYDIYTSIWGIEKDDCINAILTGISQDCDEVWYSSIYRITPFMRELLEYATDQGIPIVEKWSLSFMSDISVIKQFIKKYSLVPVGKVTKEDDIDKRAMLKELPVEEDQQEEDQKEKKYWSELASEFGDLESKRNETNKSLMVHLSVMSLLFIEEFYKEGMDGKIKSQLIENQKYVRISEEMIESATKICRMILSQYYFNDKKDTTEEILKKFISDDDIKLERKSLNYCLAMAACEFLDTCYY